MPWLRRRSRMRMMEVLKVSTWVMVFVECVERFDSFEVFEGDRLPSIFIGVLILKYTPTILFRP
jgi:hypothetical protein